MLQSGEKFGAFIVPTGIGASIGGYAGDASCWARKFSKIAKLIVNPNVVNAGVFSGITENMLYIEGYSLDSFFKGEIKLLPSQNNKLGVVFDRAIPKDVLNIHINTINAVKTVYGIDIVGHEITKSDVGVEFYIDNSGISTGKVSNPETILESAQKLIQKGADAIAIVCFFEDPENDNSDYAKGIGTDPVGGVEAIISHYISQKLKIPCAHSPAFEDYTITSELVDSRAAAEYITPTFLPCILLGLSKAPKFSMSEGISVDKLDFLIMSYNSVGAIPIFEAVKKNIEICLIRENKTVLDVTCEKLGISRNIKVFDTYQQCYNYLRM